MAFAPSSTPFTMQWWFCLSWKPPYSCQSHGASFKVFLAARLKNCSSTLLWSFGPFEPRCLQQQCSRKNYNFGTATSYHELRVLNRDCAAQQKWSCKVVGRHQLFLCNPDLCCVGEALELLLIVALSFHDQWHLFQVRRQPPCSDGFACPGSHHSSLANRTGATIKGVVAKLQNCSSKLCWFFGPFEPRSLHQGRLRKK